MHLHEKQDQSPGPVMCSAPPNFPQEVSVMPDRQHPFPAMHRTAHKAARRTPRLSALIGSIAVAGSLAACGGGGGGDTAPVMDQPDTPATSLPALPLQRHQDAENAPILYDGSDLHVGPDVAPAPDQLHPATRHGDIALFHGTVADGVNADRVIAYLADDARENSFNPRFEIPVHRFDEPPTVILAQGTSARMADLTVRALQLVNAALPRDWQLHLDPTPGPAGNDAYLDPQEQRIHIQFAPLADWPPDPDRPDNATGEANRTVTSASIFDENSNTFTFTTTVTAAAILVDPTGNRTDEAILDTIVHEILHTLGRNHPSAIFGDDTIMGHYAAHQTHILHPLDRAALLAVYGLLGLGSTDASLAQDLGPWSDTSTHLLGRFSAGGQEVSFGVALRNGLAQPWATGPAPLTNLADNAQVSGSASWSGRLLGFTPQAEPVAGAADLTIVLDTLDGDLEFTELEQWTAGQPPGAAGSGTTWSDGDLSYTVDVRGNTFTRSGGDLGVVTGAFLGTEHQAMGGTLQRDDLSAAFGGSR